MVGRGRPFGDVAVAGSRGSAVPLAIAPRIAAASATVCACGPTVSCVCEIGITPARLVSPTVGLIPEVRPLAEGRLAEDDCAGLAQLLRHGRVLRRRCPDEGK